LIFVRIHVSAPDTMEFAVQTSPCI